MILARSGNDFLHRLRWEPALVFDPRQTFLLYSHLKNAIFDERSGGVVAGVNPENFLLRRSSCSVLLSATDKDSRLRHRSSHRRHRIHLVVFAYVIRCRKLASRTGNLHCHIVQTHCFCGLFQRAAYGRNLRSRYRGEKGNR